MNVTEAKNVTAKLAIFILWNCKALSFMYLKFDLYINTRCEPIYNTYMMLLYILPYS